MPPHRERALALPIDGVIPDLLQKLRQSRAAIVQAEPGSGKTTRVPRALLAEYSEVLVLEPRRIAARLAARRVASELGEEVGKTVGFQVRMEDISSSATKLRFLTEGILTRRLMSDPQLRGVGAVVLDEFHERGLSSELALAWIARLQQSTRPDLKLVVMSATLESRPLADWLGGAAIVEAKGQRFSVDVRYLERPDSRALEAQVLGAVKRVLQRESAGDLLVFLPGVSEIGKCERLLAPLAEAEGLELLRLHGALPAAEQDRAVTPGKRRRIILSTNVAETSVTIEGIAAVIDSGLARVARFSPWSGLASLTVEKISRASAVQRAGRAGRTRDGTCERLYTREDFEARAASEAPEIVRADYAETLLALKGLGDDALPFFEPPPKAHVVEAATLLRELDATDASGALTALGKRMLRFPVHPRLARILLAAEALGVAKEGARAVALLREVDWRRQELPADSVSTSDLDALSLPPRVEREVGELARRLARDLKQTPPPRDTDAAVRQAMLAGFVGNVAKRRSPKSDAFLLSRGGSATLAKNSTVRDSEYLVVLDAEARGEQVLIRLASAVEPEWLLDRVTAEELLTWEEGRGRVEALTRLRYGELTLEETRTTDGTSPEARALFLAKVRELGLAGVCSAEVLTEWRARLEAADAARPDYGLRAAGEAAELQALLTEAETKRSLAELKSVDWGAAVLQALPYEAASRLRELATERITLPSGRQVRVEYRPGLPPSVSSRLQDFFGAQQGPALAGRPLTLRLLAPNGREVQVTQDLAGFWTRHYPSIRSELMRRYPRHAWPADPLRPKG